MMMLKKVCIVPPASCSSISSFLGGQSSRRPSPSWLVAFIRPFCRLAPGANAICLSKRADDFSSCDSVQFGWRRHLGTTSQYDIEDELPHSVGTYNSISIHTDQLGPHFCADNFSKILRASLERWHRNHHSSVWLHVHLEHAGLLGIARGLGFRLHHAADDAIVMNCWLNNELTDRVPPYASHQVGVCGCVIRRDTNEVLLVKDRHKLPVWKFPGGLSDHSEDIADTAVREVGEETGIDAEFKSILAFRQQHHQPNTFDRSDMYFVCRLDAKTHEINMCTHEVLECRWMGIKELANCTDTTPLSRRIAGLLIQGQRNDYKSVDITMEQFDAVYPGLTYKLFHRPVELSMPKSTRPTPSLDHIAQDYS